MRQRGPEHERSERAVTGHRWLRLGVALVIAMALLTGARTSRGQERRIEAGAKDALKHARADFQAGDFDTGLARLLKASKACGTLRCAAPTRAALLRDQGVMRLRRGEAKKAASLFAEAVRVDARVDLTPPYDVPDVRAAWGAATGATSVAQEAPPAAGDFRHTPVTAQAVQTPIPLYVEYEGGEHLASVVVKYRSSDQGEWKHAGLERMGSGWGGQIPCSEVTPGVLSYYIQGFDAAGSPNALSGDPKRPFRVSVTPTLEGPAPSLPGHAPPVACEEGGEKVNLASSCVDDSQCSGGTCEAGHCAVPTERTESDRGFARIWVGVSGALDIVPLSSSNDVCALGTSGTPFNTAGYTCVNPTNGTDFPSRTNTAENDTLTPGHAGNVNGGPAVGDVRVLASVDYALTANLLLGARAGVVVHTGAGPAAFEGGKGLQSQLHLELRGTYVFGAQALSHGGFAPLVLVDAGVAHFDAGRTVTVNQTGIGPLQKKAYRTGGPGFAGVGVGTRFAFSQRVAFTAVLKLAEAFGGSSLTAIGPEVGLAYGF